MAVEIGPRVAGRSCVGGSTRDCCHSGGCGFGGVCG